MPSTSQTKLSWTWDDIKRLPEWLWDGRCVFLPVALGIAHLLALHSTSISPYIRLAINNIIIAGLPLLGGFLIVRSIDANLKRFQDITLAGLAKNWGRRCPIMRQKPRVIDVEMLSEVEASATFHWTIDDARRTPDHIELFEQRIHDLENHMEREIKNIRDDLSQKVAMLRALNTDLHGELTAVSNRIRESTSHGVPDQIMGFLLATHAALVNAFV